MVADAPLVHRVRLAAVVTSLALLAQAVSVLAIPAAIVGIGGAMLGLRRVGRTPSEAELPLGVALVTSLLTGWFSLLAGVPGLLLAALVASGSAWLALRTCRELAARRRRTWGVRQLDVLHRQRELDDRRAGWVEPPDEGRPVPGPNDGPDDGSDDAGPGGGGPHGRDRG